MLDVLQEEQALEDDLARQPLYAAREATVPGQRAGVCLACSYHCLEVSLASRCIGLCCTIDPKR